MTNLSELYTDFFRVDLDAPGGYARVADVIVRQEDGTPVHRAFKLMRHELDGKQVGLQRFENELKILVEITKDKNAPSVITRIYDSGFVEAELSKSLHNLKDKNEKLNPIPNLEIVSTGMDIQKFLDTKFALAAKEPDHWLPYLVVDLAPYNDSLLRQIKAQSAGDFLNIYKLPANTVVDMSLQLLDVMDYMHKQLRYAYIDWKPEHIYWNEALRQLKVIDWNVTTQLNGGPGEKQTIREDIRMFCGAALYCSLALTDPEDLDKSIGPDPQVPKNLMRQIRPRYWTDKPNFYQRDSVLDKKIKLLVQKGLDPNQGFNTPQELRSALIQLKLPNEAILHYRRARSYIAAKDYSYAKLALETAIATATTAGMNYPDAEKLLISVFLELRQWREALNLYKNAIELEPENARMKKEFGGLQGLLRAESDLRNKGMLRLFTNVFQLQNILDATKDIINPDNPLYSFVKQQYSQIRLAQISSVFILLIVVLFALVSTGKPNFSHFFTATTTPTSTLTLIPSTTPTQIIATPEPTITLTILPTLQPTNTLEPTVTVISLKAYGVLIGSYFYPLEEPNGKRVGPALARKQVVVIVDIAEDHTYLWYKCKWEINGVVGEGWILKDYIRVVPAPTPTPVLTPTP